MLLRTRLIVPVVALVGALAFAFNSFLIYRQYAEDRDQLVQDATVVGGLQAAAVAPSVWDLDNARVKEILHGLTAYPDFVSAEITDAAGKQIAREGNPEHTGVTAGPSGGHCADGSRQEAGHRPSCHENFGAKCRYRNLAAYLDRHCGFRGADDPVHRRSLDRRAARHVPTA